MIKKDLIDDLELRFSSGKPSDDDNISRRQLSDWVDMARDSIISTSIEIDFDTSMIKKEEFLDVVSDNSSPISGVLYYIELENMPLSNRVNSGVVKVVTNNNKVIYETNTYDIGELNNLCFSKPSSSNLIYYLEGKRLYINGLTALSFSENDFIVHYIPSEVDREASEDSEYYLSPAYKDLVLKLAYEIGAQELLEDFSDTENDGE